MNRTKNDGWKEAAIAWTVCESIHREYANGKDPLYTTRNKDFAKHADDARKMYGESQSTMPKFGNLLEALTPSDETKADYIGRFYVELPDLDGNGVEFVRRINVPWVVIKQIMLAIRERALGAMHRG